ncbi:MAG: substrate-binding domain-containing protein [Bacilli bacterium]|nr:substrate-binding domain-containing protein [Bacilli bacterium]
MKKKLFLFVLMFLGVLITGCSQTEVDHTITVYTRDTTSGTRDGFFTTIAFPEAISDNSGLVNGYVELESNGGIINALKNDEYGIGYISLASLETSELKGLSYEGISPTEANVINETYTMKRNFNYIIRENYDLTAEADIITAFLAFLETSDAKATVVSKSGIVEITGNESSWDDIKVNYPISLEDNSGITINFGGSTSVESVAKALSAEFSIKCGNFIAEHNHTGSGDAYKRTQGSEKDGANKLHIGFASREFKLTSTETAVQGTYGVICVDAIVAVVNNSNSLGNITAEDLKKIYNGEITKWSELE